MTLVCPKCGKAFGEDDINVRTDVAHCRTCGQDFSYVALKDNEEFLKAMHGTPPKHFKVELTDRGPGWGDLHLTFCRNAFRKGLYLTLVALFVVLGIGGAVWFHHFEIREGVILAPLISALVIGFLTCIAATVQRTLEIEMKGGKGRVWAYWLFRGKGRAFEYDGETEFSPLMTADIIGRPVLTRFFIENIRSKPVSVRIGVIGDDISFLNAALVYALPRNESFFEPEPDRPETPEEAEARRVMEANEAKARKRAKWGWLRFVLVMAVVIGLKVWMKDRPKKMTYSQRVLVSFLKNEDYHAVAEKEPFFMPTVRRERIKTWLEVFDEVSALWNEFTSLTEASLADLDELCVRTEKLMSSFPARLAEPESEMAFKIANTKCELILKTREKFRNSISAENPDPNEKHSFKVHIEQSVEVKRK